MYNRIDRRIILEIRLLTCSLVLFFCFHALKAQVDPISITTGSITASTICPGRPVSVPFTANASFDANNEFTAQISDAAGSFSNPISIGTLQSTASSGTISARIPSDIPAGTGYRIRVVGSNPESIGTDNGTDLTIESISSIGSATSNLNNICPNTSIELTANEVVIGEGAELIWYDGPVEGTPTEVGRSNPLTISPSKTTTYFTTLDGTCNYTEAFVTIIVGEGTAWSIGTVISDIDNICPNTNVELTANGVIVGTGATLTWYDGPEGTGTALGTSNPLMVSPAITATYYARLEDSCNTVEESVTVTVDEEEEDVYNFPTAFTPNGDGVNDVWDVGENRIDPGVYVWIYDNNGQLVFKSIGYQKPWDGNYKGKPQPVGTYYYVIKLNGKKQKAGFVMILK